MNWAYSGVGLLSNGRLAFGYATYHRQPTNGFPIETTYPVVTIAPLWGPFSFLPSASSAAWTQTISTDRFVVCWEKLLLNGDAARPATVQCEYRRDGTFRFHYGYLSDGVPAASTVGMQNLDNGWNYSHGHTNRLFEGMTITLRPVGLDGWAEADADGDGLSNYDEFMLGTDPRLADTDQDGPSDYWELSHGFSPLVAQLAPPDPDSDGDGVPDRWENWLGTPTNNAALGQQAYLDPDGDGFSSWYEMNVLGSDTNSAASPSLPNADHADILAAITSSRPCVLRLVGDGQSIEIPWMPGVSPAKIRLRLTRGQRYLANLSRVPTNTTFTTTGFWWANLAFEAVPGLPDLALPPVIANGTNTYFVGTVRIQTVDRGGDFWLTPGVASSPTNHVDAWRIEIAETDTYFCHSSTNETLFLKTNSLYEGQIEWLGLPPGTTRTNNPLTFNPSTVPPGRYTVTARCVLDRLVSNSIPVEIRNIGVYQSTVWLSANDTTPYTIELTTDTWPTDDYIVRSEPWGITSLTFCPYWLDPGVYTVYISNSECGNAQVTVNIVELDLDVDTDRDGTIEDSDDENSEATFTLARGALVPPRQLDMIVTTNLSLSQLSRLAIHSSGANPTNGALVRLIPHDQESADLCLLDNNGAEVPCARNSPLYLPSCPTNFYVYSHLTRKYDQATGKPQHFTLDLELINNGVPTVADSVVLTVAPLILPSECNTADAIYSTLPIAGISNLTVVPVTAGSNGVTRWTQDEVKFTKTQVSSSIDDDVFVCLGHPGAGNLEVNLRQLPVPGLTWYLDGDGGNMMATPPLGSNAPYGMLMLGTKHTNSLTYWASQGIQVIVTISNDWLLVGHVDELFMWVATDKVLYADPWIAADLLHGEIASGHGTNIIWWGDETTSNTNALIQDIVIDSGKITTLPTAMDATSTNTTIAFTNAIFAVDDYLRVDNEILKVLSTNSTVITVSRAQAGRTSTSHIASSVIYAISPVLRRNLLDGQIDQNSKSVVNMIGDATNQLRQALGTYSANLVPVPVLFDGYFDQQAQKTYFLAQSANLANCLFVNASTVYYSEPGAAVFRNYFASIVTGAQPVNVWNDYHCQMGEIHCATAVKRSVTASPPWWSQRVSTNDWGNYP